MKIFSWMQRRLNAKQNSLSANHHILQEPSSKEEFSDWPHGLLSIGTFGNNTVKKEVEKCNLQGSEVQDNEVGELQKELKLIFDKQAVELSSLDELDTSFEIDKTTSHATHEDNANNVIGKKSLSFLLKKMFFCSSGRTPIPSLRDPLPESRLEKPRMEKILRAILNKKINPQRSSPKVAAAAKKYLQNRQFYMTDGEDEMFEEANEGSKWVKTDSEFIVLEI